MNSATFSLDHPVAKSKVELPTFINDRVPGAEVISPTRIRNWKSIHSIAHVGIEYESVRMVGRWGAEDRKRPFVVYVWFPKHLQRVDYSSSTTLTGALRIAQRAVKEYA